MAYLITNNKPRLIMRFVPGVTVIADEKYASLVGKDDGVLTSPQRFFREQVELKHLVATKADSKKSTNGEPVELVSGMNVAEAIKYCKECGDARMLKSIAVTEKRSDVSKAATDKLNEISPRD